MPLPTPPSWPRHRPGRPAAIAAFVMGVAFLALGVAQVRAGGTDPGMSFGIGVFWFAFGSSFLPRRRPGVVSRDGALVIPVSRRRVATPFVGSGALALGLATSVGLPWGAVVVAAFAVLFGVVARRGLGGELALDPAGITFAVPAYRRRLPWEEAAAVSMERRDRLVVRAEDGGTFVRTDGFALDPLVLFWTLHYYVTHPEARGELADERAVDRVRREDLAPESAATNAPASGS